MNNEINRYLGVLVFPFVDINMVHQDCLQVFLDTKRYDIKSKKDIRKAAVNFVAKHYNIYNYDEIYKAFNLFTPYHYRERQGSGSPIVVCHDHTGTRHPFCL